MMKEMMRCPTSLVWKWHSALGMMKEEVQKGCRLLLHPREGPCQLFRQGSRLWPLER